MKKHFCDSCWKLMENARLVFLFRQGDFPEEDIRVSNNDVCQECFDYLRFMKRSKNEPTD